jgi:hypothetical protein
LRTANQQLLGTASPPEIRDVGSPLSRNLSRLLGHTIKRPVFGTAFPFRQTLLARNVRRGGLTRVRSAWTAVHQSNVRWNIRELSNLPFLRSDIRRVLGVHKTARTWNLAIRRLLRRSFEGFVQSPRYLPNGASAKI